MRKIAVINQKGGVGKTTTTVNIAGALAESGRRVCLIDLDPQAHMTIHLHVEPEEIESGSYKVLTQSSKFSDEIMQVRPNLWLLPANIHLVGAESELVSVVGRETILREAVSDIDDKFDYMIIDCAPSLGLLTLNALAAVDEILIPLQPHFLALQGMGRLLQTVDLVNKRINPNLKVKWVLLCMFDSRSSLPNEVKADIEQFLASARGTKCAWSEAQVCPVYIRRNIKLAEAPSYGQTIFEYEPSCNGAEDYRKAAAFLDGRLDVTQGATTQDAAGDIEEAPVQNVPSGDEQAEPGSSAETVAEVPAAEVFEQSEQQPVNTDVQEAQQVHAAGAIEEIQTAAEIELVGDDTQEEPPAETSQESATDLPIEIREISKPEPAQPGEDLIRKFDSNFKPGIRPFG
ncbi:MAG: ParA family protein [Candidatus Brocadiia bacterium]|nr:MAG: ParA family protein [Candidatus Brocadiia bacterium]